jgi:hypothetical protein
MPRDIRSAAQNTSKDSIPGGKNDDWVTIIWVVKEVHSQGLERVPMAQIFEAQSQSLHGAPPSRWSPSPSPYLANVGVADNTAGVW